MLIIDKEGWVQNNRIEIIRRPNIRNGEMKTVNGIIVHQTGASTAQSTLNSYLHKGANGAHFLIDKDGTIFQTGSVFWRQRHVGNLRSRCLAEHRCSPVETKRLAQLGAKATNAIEGKKSVPDRYPSNLDSIGIELVGEYTGEHPKEVYISATAAQNLALAWLVAELRQNFKVPLTEIFRHPKVSYKNMTEAESAQW